jgi:tRNA (guanosine-2'-O-)-methyltransferase
MTARAALAAAVPPSYGALALLAGSLAACAPSAREGPARPHRAGAAQPTGERASAERRAASDVDAPSTRPRGPCLPVAYEVCFNALDDNCNGALEEGCGVPAGVVQFMIGWDAPRADVDLNVTDPNGELIEAGRVVQSGLIKSRDCPGRRQECAGVNYENVFLEGNKAPTRGTYRVSVALESLGGEPPPVWVNLSCRLGAKRQAFEIRLVSPEDEQHVELTL